MDNHGNDSTFMTLPWLIIAFTSFLFGTENFLDCSIGPDKFSMLTAPYKFSVFTVTDCILYDYSLTDRFVLTSVSVFTAIDFPVHYNFFDYILWLINSPWTVFGVNSHNKFFRCLSGKDFQVRLVDENGQANQGRVEVFYNGAWGTVCDDKFDRNAAAVVCTRMGYERYNCMVMLTFVHRGNVVWPCLSLYKDVKLYGCVYLFTRCTDVFLCIPLYKKVESYVCAYLCSRSRFV